MAKLSVCATLSIAGRLLLLLQLYYAGHVYSGKRNVTVWRPSVSLSLQHTHRDSPGAACDAASVHFFPIISRFVYREPLTVKYW